VDTYPLPQDRQRFGCFKFVAAIQTATPFGPQARCVNHPPQHLLGISEGEPDVKKKSAPFAFGSPSSPGRKMFAASGPTERVVVARNIVWRCEQPDSRRAQREARWPEG